MNTEHYKAASEHTDANERALTPAYRKAESGKQKVEIPQHSPLPERTFAEHPWPSNDSSEAIAVWRKSYVKALAEREAYKTHADKLAEALRHLTKEIKLGTLNVRKDFSLMNAHACATKALHQYDNERQ